MIMHKDIAVIILAAGEGKRMKSGLPKVLHKVAGRPMLDYVFEKVNKLKIKEKYLVVGYKAEELSGYKKEANIIVQKEQLGTGHAAEKVLPFFKKKAENVLILYGDMPLVSIQSLREFIEHHYKTKADLTVLTAEGERKSDFGRIIREPSGRVTKIVEAKDATCEQLNVKEVNTGIYCIRQSSLIEALPNLGYNNRQKEKYLTDVVEYLVGRGKNVQAKIIKDPYLALGINTRSDLAKVSRIIFQNYLEELMLSGVTVVSPETTFVETSVKIGKDTVILPYTVIQGNTNIGKDCIIGPFTRIVASKIGEKAEIQNSVVIESFIGKGSKCGPFAYLRPETRIGNYARIGDFVEIKKSRINDFSKVPHLSYIGDAEIGKHVNVGAGVITCNFDGVKKHQTFIEDDVYLGANTNLVAPVRLGRGSKTGAGSVVTKNVPSHSLAVGIPARIIKKIK